MSEGINKSYFEDNPHSFGGRYRLYDFYGRKQQQAVDEALKQNDIYSRFKKYKRPKKFSPVYVYRKRELFQADVGYMRQENSDASGGFKYLFTVIDCFTKYAWIYPMKVNNCKTVTECFEDVLNKCGRKPERLNTDRGSEVKCKAFKKYMKDMNIHHYFSYSDRKCPIVERFIQSIKELIYKICAEQRTHDWVSILDQAMKIYLNREHGTTKMSPTEAEKDENQQILLQTYIKKYDEMGGKPEKAKFKVGDTVRIYYGRRVFNRAYDEQFTREYFTIAEVLHNLPVIRYRLKDYSGEPIIGSFFQNELVAYKHSLNGADDFWEGIPIAEKTNRRTKKKQYKIHYVGWPDKYDEWIDEEDTRQLT